MRGITFLRPRLAGLNAKGPLNKKPEGSARRRAGEVSLRASDRRGALRRVNPPHQHLPGLRRRGPAVDPL